MNAAIPFFSGSDFGAFGVGIGYAHAGEKIQLVLEDGGRRFVVAVHQPMVSQGSWATFTYDPWRSDLIVEPACKKIAQRAAELTLQNVLNKPARGVLTVRNTFEHPDVPNGALSCGFGQSTSDGTAAVHAVTNAFGVSVSEADAFRLVWQAEGATDGTAWGNRAVAVRTRRGEVHEDFGAYLPPLLAVTFVADYGGVDTHGCSRWQSLDKFTTEEILHFRCLYKRLRRAIRRGDSLMLAEVETLSSAIQQRAMPKPRWEEIEKIKRHTDAMGLSVSHSGTVVSLLFTPNAAEDGARAAALLQREGFGRVWTHISGGSPHLGFEERGYAV